MPLSLLHFWHCHPALLYGIAFMLGIFSHFCSFLSLITPLLFLWFPFAWHFLYSKNQTTLKQLILSVLVFFTGWAYAAAHYTFPLLPPEGVKGMAQVKIKSVNVQPSPFGDNWFYHCEIEQFIPHLSSQSILSSLPCSIRLPVKERVNRPLAHQDYWIEGKLKKTSAGFYVLKVSPKAQWKAIPGTWSLAERRFLWKKKISQWIESHFSSSSASFLAGLITGEFDDYWMRQQFARFGLQHLLAISGFHFAIIASFLSLALRLFFPTSIRTLGLLLFLGSYCLFLGPQPSILRAWIMSSVALLGGVLEKEATALNTLGVALLLILGYNPLLCHELGFQLSFTITAAILLFYHPAQAACHILFPPKELEIALQMNRWNQHAYCLLTFFREALALTLAVNLFALPLTLYYFHQFPWMSLLYNLFFPFLASASLCLLLVGIVLSWIPLLGTAIHAINDHYTFFLLQLIDQIPFEMDHYLRVEPFDSFWMTLYLCLISMGGALWQESSKQDKAFVFI